MRLHLTIVYTLPAARCDLHRAPGHCEDKEVDRVQGCKLYAELLQTGSLPHQCPESETYKPTGGWKKICFYVWFEGAEKHALHEGGCVPHLYLVLCPCPQETLQDAQLDQELHTQELWQL